MGNVDDEVFECLTTWYSNVLDKEVTDDVKWKRNT